MILYHGSLSIINNPVIKESDRTLDYGCGFYTTTDYDQAERWVKRHRGDGHIQGYVNIYRIEKTDILKHRVLWFDKPDEKWVDFVYKNRTDRTFRHEYDFVYGPVANDKVYAAFALYEDGLLNKNDLINELKTYTLVDQLLLHTASALKCLEFISAMNIKL